MALPAFGQQDTFQIRMPIEANAEHVEDFALQPVGRGPDIDGAWNTLAFGDHSFYANALVAVIGIKNPKNVELLFTLGIVNGSNIHTICKAFFVFQNSEDIRDDRRIHHEIVLPQVSAGLADARSVAFVEIRYKWGFPRSRDWPSRLRRCRGCGLLLARRRRRLGFVWHSYRR